MEALFTLGHVSNTHGDYYHHYRGNPKNADIDMSVTIKTKCCHQDSTKAKLFRSIVRTCPHDVVSHPVAFYYAVLRWATAAASPQVQKNDRLEREARHAICGWHDAHTHICLSLDVFECDLIDIDLKPDFCQCEKMPVKCGHIYVSMACLCIPSRIIMELMDIDELMTRWRTRCER